MAELYNESLSQEWIDWVESAKGTRTEKIFPFIKEWIANLKPKVIADIGCGQGACSELIDDSINYIGIDPSSMLIARAKELYPSKKFKIGNAYEIPLEKSSVDTLISVWVWSHLEDLKLAAKEMFRVLNSKGKFLVITANPETYEERKTFYKEYKIDGKLLTGTFDLGGGKALTDTTLYLHSIDEVRGALESAGFKLKPFKRMRKAESNSKGLYLVIEGSKD